MKNYIFIDDFERTECSDEIHGILGRALIIATRFDSMCKALSISYKIRTTVKEKNKELNNEEFKKIIDKITVNRKTLGENIEFLPTDNKLKSILHDARQARNEIAHSLALGFEGCIEYRASRNINNFILEASELLRSVAKGDLIISALISYSNKEPIPRLDEKFCTSYENKIVNWVVTRYDI